ncbi:hypothetical protein GALL_219780 [mine drainage metagenome]|uniref:Secretion system C-terminal sorting domain-containing protein n=1 Tax=mine drainage metagenome TaxID=410659 RepID=A0A1J5S6S1_9ZZZZ
MPSLINGFTYQAFGANEMMNHLLAPSLSNDHVLVLVQLQGGNDGLNTVIPLEYFSEYVNARPNIYIPENKVLAVSGTQKIGLNPAMTGLQRLSNDGILKIIQSVGYDQPNFSHFRATDIWMSGSDSTQILNTGWAGRYLDAEFPNFPNGYPNASMTDPLAIQIGSLTSFTCQGPSINMGMSISSTSNFYSLINGSSSAVPDTPAGKELSFIRIVNEQTQQYDSVVKNAAAKVTKQVVYPSNNYLADQLKIVARLIGGGLKTKIYMVSYGSFDTHADQVNSSDTTTGTHAHLLGNVSSAIAAFQDDLKQLGADDRVVGMTFSEFGRRIKSNASGGTDHGAAAPMFIFGKNVLGGVLGNTPQIPSSITVNDNVPFQYDFRSVYATLLSEWLCVDDAELQLVMLKNFQQLPLVNAMYCNKAIPNPSGDVLISNYPNPFTATTKISFATAGGHTLVQLINASGAVVKNIIDTSYQTAGKYIVDFDGSYLASGVYYLRLQNLTIQKVHPIVKVR